MLVSYYIYSRLVSLIIIIIIIIVVHAIMARVMYRAFGGNQKHTNVNSEPVGFSSCVLL